MRTRRARGRVGEGYERRGERERGNANIRKATQRRHLMNDGWWFPFASGVL